MPVVRMPNGDQVRFPDDWSRERIQAKIKEKFPEASATDVPVGGYVGQTLKGAAQSVAGTVGTGLNLTDAMGAAAFTNPITAPTAGLSAIIPKDWRKQLTEFSNAPYTPGYEGAGRLGYVGAELAPLGLGAKGAVAGAKTGMEAWKSASPVVKGLAKDAAAGVGGEMAIDALLGHLPYGMGGLVSIAARHALRKALEKGGKGAMEAGGKEAEDVAAAVRGRMGNAPVKPKQYSPGWTPEKEAELNRKFPKVQDQPQPKPRVRVKAPSRPMTDDSSD